MLALGMMPSTNAGERESFDFDWKFKYFGPGEPGDSTSPARASASQPGHGPALAVDGDLSTRWCAPDENKGYSIEVSTGTRTKVQVIQVVWEKSNNFDVDLEIVSSSTKRIVSIAMRNEDTLNVPVGNRAVRSLKLTVRGGTSNSSWASIREIRFLDEDGMPIKLKNRKLGNAFPAAPGYDDDKFTKVQLPHDWAISSPFLKDKPNETGKLPWDGWGCYRKVFEVPEDFDAGQARYYLDFDGVMSNPKVYVNGRLAGEWAYGYNSFRVDMTPYLKAGKNLVAVVASNLPLSTRWYPGAGIYRHVWLEKTGPVHLAHWPVYVTTPEINKDSATVEIRTRVTNTSSKDCEVKLVQRVGSAKATSKEITLKAGEEQEVMQVLSIRNPKLWSCESPDLYELHTSLISGNEEIDSHKTCFGVRSIEWTKDGFYLNGERVQLKGVCEHHDLGPLGAAFHTRGYERKIEILKEMGCNSIRMTHNPPAPEVLDLCDRHGILVIDELFDIWEAQKYDKVNGYHVYWPKWWRKDVRNFMLRDRNHPCIIAWSGGNEVPELGTARGREVSQALRKEIHKYDLTRPYTVGSNDPSSMTNGFADTVDIFGFNYKPDMYADFRVRHPMLPLYGSETNSCVASRDTYFFPLGWRVGDGARAFHVSAYGLSAPGWGTCPDIEMSALDRNPQVAGEYVWTGFDYIGEPTPYNQDASNIGNFHGASEEEKRAAMEQLKAMGNKAPSRSSYFGIIDLAGFAKDTYYLYRSRWAPEKRTCHILPHWNWKGREGQVTPVMVFTSGDKAELFLNGKSLGVRKRGQGGTFTQKLTVGKNDYRFVWEDVVYEPGTLMVKVWKDGKPWAKDTRTTTGAAKNVKVSVDRDVIVGDGQDLSYIALSTIDAKGKVVPTDCRRVSFRISGPAELVGFCNGNQTDQTSMVSKEQSFFNGRILAVVRGKRGKSGKAEVQVQAEGLPKVSIPITVESDSEKDEEETED